MKQTIFCLFPHSLCLFVICIVLTDFFLYTVSLFTHITSPLRKYIDICLFKILLNCFGNVEAIHLYILYNCPFDFLLNLVSLFLLFNTLQYFITVIEIDMFIYIPI